MWDSNISGGYKPLVDMGFESIPDGMKKFKTRILSQRMSISVARLHFNWPSVNCVHLAASRWFFPRWLTVRAQVPLCPRFSFVVHEVSSFLLLWSVLPMEYLAHTHLSPLVARISKRGLLASFVTFRARCLFSDSGYQNERVEG